MIVGLCNINFVAIDVMQAVCGPTIAWFFLKFFFPSKQKNKNLIV
jgi:hypothetical protein